MFFCFKQKTAYEMRMSDWSSDVCSSDLGAQRGGHHPHRRDRAERDGVPDVLLRDLRVHRGGGVRLVCQALSAAGPLPELTGATTRPATRKHLPMNLSITLIIVIATGIVSWLAFNNRQLLDRLILWT